MNYSKYSNNNNPLTKGNHQEKLYSRIWLYVLRIACIVVLLGTFAVAGLGLGAFAGMLKDVTDISLGSLGISEYTTTFVDQEGNTVAQLNTATNRTHVDIDDMPQHMLNAVVAIEDARFYSHNGIDLEGILRAGVANLKSGGTSEGGSTLTQQVIKKLVLTSDQNWKRKIQEWYLALQLEYKLTQEYGKERAKRMILDTYLNYNFLGYNCYGVETAAKRYFNKDIKDLSLSECAVLAGIFQAPSAYDPIENEDNICRNRQLQVLKAMYDQQYITEQEYKDAVADNVFERIANYDQEYTNSAEERIYSYFIDSTIQTVMNDLKNELGYSSEDAFNKLYYGGLKVHITQDQKIQKIIDDYFDDSSNFQRQTWYQLDYRLTLFDRKDPSITDNYGMTGLYKTEEDAKAAAEEYLQRHITPEDVRGVNYVDSIDISLQPQYSMTIMDYHNGHIVGMAGGRGQKTGNLSLNRAADKSAARQPGSTFKVIASFAQALESGLSPASVVDDSPFVAGDWYPSNWWGAEFYGLTPIRQGIARSMNIVAARTNVAIGIRDNFELAEKFGFTTLRDTDDTENQDTSDVVGSLSLGSCSVTNLELTAAYGAIANGGIYTEPIYYTRILDNNDNIIYEKVPSTHYVIKETTAWLLTDMMRDVLSGQNGGTAAIGRFSNTMAQAGKTGTTNDTKDLWLVGYTPYYVAAVWTGYDYYVYRNTSSQSLENGYHATVWRDIMKQVHADLPDISEFAKPDGIVSAKVCLDSGMLAGELCSQDPRGSRVYTEYFDEDNVPKETCTCHVRAEVCVDSGMYPSSHCPASSIQSVVCITRTPAQLAAIEEAYEFCKTLPEEEVHIALDYSGIRDWYYMAPQCINTLYLDPVTHQKLDKQTDNCLVVDVSQTHTCPVHSSSSSGGTTEESGGGNEESNSESKEESGSSSGGVIDITRPRR